LERVRRLLAGIALVLTVVALSAAPAWAHDETGAFSATRAEPNASGGYTIDLLLTYTNDGHGAEGAALTVTAQGATGPAITVPMAPGARAGAYTGDVVLDPPGTYTITASSPDPVASTTFTVEVAAPTTTTTAGAPATTAGAPTTTTTDEPATTTTTTIAAEDESSSNSAANVVVNGALLVIGAASAFFAIRWWRNRRSAS